MTEPSVHERYRDTAFIVLCRDGANGAALRAQATAAHLAYIETVLPELNVAGPLYDESGTRTVGSVFCVRSKHLSRVREIIENDPYFKAGVFAAVEYFPFLPAAGQYIGSKIW
ncbi:MAG: YciI family protein [Steroidobacteraceae bacterium]|nr:YciI family protein [Steroidobacteraceae bacterium]MDW8257983.1 YciI family protein [Gammaproteobacteria bacterium]